MAQHTLSSCRCWQESVLMRATGIVYCVTDNELNVVCANLGFTQFTDFTPDKICGQCVTQWVRTRTSSDWPQDQQTDTWLLQRGEQQTRIQVLCQKSVEGWVFLGTSMPEQDKTVLEQMTQMENELIGLNREHQKTIHELKSLQNKLRELATTDELTGTVRRRFFFEHAEQLRQEAVRYRKVFSLIFFDLDHFKSVNDNYGHSAGDEVLRQVADRIRSTLRASDLFARYGGEEFCILAPESDAAKAQVFAERIRKVVAQKPVNVGGGNHINVTISLGVAEFNPEETISTLVQRADMGVYQSKDNGRNCVTVC